MTKQNETIEEELLGLELLVGSVPGTMISRVLLSKELWRTEEVCWEDKRKSDSELVWCLGFGTMTGPKVFSYGTTIQQAVDNCKRKLNTSPFSKKSKKIITKKGVSKNDKL